MQLERDQRGPGPIVTGFGPGGFRIGETRHRAVLLTVATALAWTPPPLAALTPADLQALINTDPEFILLGTGATLQRPSVALTAILAAQNIGLEPMDSRAAARAWGVLRGEGRRIAAALYPLD
ncbi:Mth938-like domain-containing protein [Sphingomonas sp.]|uniref:Mth938-like domain-containing protein n=1 Tax=Sphingomonas sp. TaxID=28214 RepID=UPI003CC629EA